MLGLHLNVAETGPVCVCVCMCAYMFYMDTPGYIINK